MTTEQLEQAQTLNTAIQYHESEVYGLEKLLKTKDLSCRLCTYEPEYIRMEIPVTEKLRAAIADYLEESKDELKKLKEKMERL